MFAPFQYAFPSYRCIGVYPRLYSRIFGTPWVRGPARMSAGRMLWSLILLAGMAFFAGFPEAAQAQCRPPAVPKVTISAVQVQVTEGAAAEFLVAASPAPKGRLTVNANVSQSGQVLAGTPPAVVLLPAHQGSAILTVATDDDLAAEPAGMVTATLTSGSGYTIGDPASAQVTIADNDQTTDNHPATGAPSVLGSAYVGQILTASTWGIADADGLSKVTWQYQWLRGSNAISEATQSTYLAAAADVGSGLTVRVDFTDDAGHTENLTSSPTREVTEPEPGLPEVSLTSVLPDVVQPGEELTITVRIDPPIPAGAPDITAGVLIWDTGNADGVQLHAFVFGPNQAETTAAPYQVPDDGQTTADRTIRVAPNSAFDDSFRIGLPAELTVSVQGAGVAPKVATSPSPAASLRANYPNPFNSSTWIPYHLATDGPVRLGIFNTLGQRVRTLVNEAQTVGAYQTYWDGRDQKGAAVAAGVYIARLHHPSGVQVRRLLYLK